MIDLETSEHEIIQRVLETFVEQKPVEKIGFKIETRMTIDRCFKYDTVEEIVAALDREKQTAWTREIKQRLLSVSPTSLKVTLKTLRKSKTMSLVECLKMEFDLIQKFLVTKDFHEGVTATFLDKPRRKPQWQPPQLSGISEEDIDQLYFTDPSPNVLSLPSKLDLRTYPYARYALPTELDVRLAVTGEGAEFRLEGRLKTEDEIVSWFVKGHKNKWGVKEKVLDILARKGVPTEEEGIVWKD